MRWLVVWLCGSRFDDEGGCFVMSVSPTLDSVGYLDFISSLGLFDSYLRPLTLIWYGRQSHAPFLLRTHSIHFWTTFIVYTQHRTHFELAQYVFGVRSVLDMIPAQAVIVTHGESEPPSLGIPRRRYIKPYLCCLVPLQRPQTTLHHI